MKNASIQTCAKCREFPPDSRIGQQTSAGGFVLCKKAGVMTTGCRVRSFSECYKAATDDGIGGGQ